MDILSVGKKQSLMDILINKEWRMNFQSQLMNNFKKNTIIAVKLNIPGKIKNNEYIEKIFLTGLNELKKRISFTEEYNFLNRESGPEAFFVVNKTLVDVKKSMVSFEDDTKLGRLFDVDVMNSNLEKQYSRIELGLSRRQCFVCGNDAKICARNQTHSKEEISKIINNYYESIQGEF